MTASPSIPAWDDAFDVGVPELDCQHRTLFRVLAELAVAVAGGGGANALREGLDELLADGSAHFAAEEDYLERAGYPGTVKQRVQHRFFVARLSSLADRVRSGQEQLGAETLDGLASWLKGHILGLDGEYAQWLRERGR